MLHAIPGQAKCFNNFLGTPEGNYKIIAVVSSAYHLPRIARTFGEDSPQSFNEEGNPNALSERKRVLYGYDRKFERPGVKYDVLGEYDAMKNYLSGFQGKVDPTISRLSSKNTLLTQFDMLMVGSFNRHLQAAKNGLAKQAEEIKQQFIFHWKKKIGR